MGSAMEIKELLPCPFCGGEAVRMDFLDNPPFPNMRGTRYIGCLKCCVVSFTGMNDAEAVEAWNIRAERTFTDEVEEAEYHLCELERMTGETWRPERTCTIVDHFNDGPHAEEDMYYLSCGHYKIGSKPKHCPKCDAKVVE